MHNKVMDSGLYDKKLKMLKVNEHIDGVDINIGRIKIFTRGWLENESIWLHMEYKYLLELLRRGLNEEFFQLASTMLVPFIDPDMYGRSIYENSSFIVSSAHPDESMHGRGFVARLSGSTAEYVSIWIAITSGLKPFNVDEKGKISLKFAPVIPGNWFTVKPSKVSLRRDGRTYKVDVPKNCFMFNFLGKTPVLYYNKNRKNTFGKNSAAIKHISIKFKNGKKIKVKGNVIQDPYSKRIREGKAYRIEAELN